MDKNIYTIKLDPNEKSQHIIIKKNSFQDANLNNEKDVLNEILNIPIGIINSSWGGSPAEAWTDKKSLDDNFKKSEIKKISNKK